MTVDADRLTDIECSVTEWERFDGGLIAHRHVRELLAEVRRLQAELDRVTGERDRYRTGLEKVACPKPHGSTDLYESPCCYARRVLDTQEDGKSIEDGFGSTWHKCDRADCGLEVVRPGKVQCWCDTQEDG